MAKRRIHQISEIKSLQDLQRVKLQKRYEKELRNLEFQSSLVGLKYNVTPNNIKEGIISEGKSYLIQIAAKWFPSLVSKFFK